MTFLSSEAFLNIYNSWSHYIMYFFSPLPILDSLLTILSCTLQHPYLPIFVLTFHMEGKLP